MGLWAKQLRPGVLLSTTTAGVIVLLFAGAFAGFYQLYTYNNQRHTMAQEQANILAASVPAALSFHDTIAAEEYVRPLKVNPDIGVVGIYTKQGALMAGYAGPQAALPARLPLPPQKGKGVFAQVMQKGTPLGWVYVQAASEPLLNQLERYIGLAILAAMAFLVVGGLGQAQREMKRQSQRLSAANQQLQNEMEQRARAEEALRQSQKMEAIGQLAGGIAHDLNNNLMIIKGNLDLLQRKLKIGPDDKHYSRLEEGIRRAASLTQRVLSFSRKQPLSPVALDPNELISAMADLFRSSLGAHIEVEFDLKSTACALLDRNQMENVILNLVVNARDAMPSGGTVVFATRDIAVPGHGPQDLPPGDYVGITVRDTGVGMTAAVRERALDPFFTTKPFGEGTGLGLSTAAGFIAQSGGTLAIDSKPEKGTTISIILPRYDGAAAVRSTP